MHVERRPAEAFDKWPLTPVELHSFDPESKRAALIYGDALNDLLTSTGVSAELFGSVELETAGKGEWEFALYPSDDHRYWRENVAARVAYEEQKYQHCNTKRDSYHWKEFYIADVLESLRASFARRN